MLASIQKDQKESLKIKGYTRKPGKVEAKKLRNNTLVPACLYGKDIENINLSISHKDAIKLRRGQIVEIDLNGNLYRSIVKEIQYDYLKDKIIHVDFLGLKEGRFIEIQVPIEITGESQGVKKGGILQVLLNSLTIKVLPDNIPDKILIDISSLDIGDSIHVSDLIKQEEFKNIKFINKADTTIVTVTTPEEKTEEEQ